MHQNLRANVGRVWWAGEATSAEFYGFLQGAWFEGRDVGGAVAACVAGKAGGNCSGGGEVFYDVLHGTTGAGAYGAENGWDVSKFSAGGG